MNGRTAAMVASVLVIGGVVAGLYFAGSPADARLRRQDGRREQLLASLDNAVRDYHRRHGHLPPALDSAGPEWARDSLRGRDPVSNLPFDYRVLGDSTYEFCATFARSTERDLDGAWSHPEGRHCFKQVIK